MCLGKTSIGFFDKRFKKTTGTLVGVEMHSDYEYRNAKKVCFVPVYSFEVDGKEYSGTAKIYKDKAEDYDIGSTATVRYCPANPKVFTVKNRNGRIGISLIFLAIGIFMCFIR